MNNFIKFLAENNLLGKLIKDDKDIKFLSSFKKIIVKELDSKQGKKYKQKYYHWFVQFENNEIHALNLSRTDTEYVKHLLNVYCITCGKFIGQYTLSQIFELKNNNILKFNRRLLS